MRMMPAKPGVIGDKDAVVSPAIVPVGVDTEFCLCCDPNDAAELGKEPLMTEPERDSTPWLMGREA